MRSGLARAAGYAKFAARYVLLQQQVPFVLGLVPTNRCNLRCRSCRAANNGIPEMPMSQVRSVLADFHRRGFRELYIEGGEPFLWRDGRFGLEDIVAEGRQAGYFHVHVYTNGTLPLRGTADLYWVSLDGMRQSNAANRGDHFDTVVGNIRDAAGLPMVVIYTINSLNRGDIGEFLRFAARELPVVGVMFYFHTPYYGRDELFLDAGQRAAVIDGLLRLKREGLPVFNSAPALEALRAGSWPRPNRTWMVVDAQCEHVCCRYPSEDACRNCGYAACTELTAAQKLKPGALWNLMRFM